MSSNLSRLKAEIPGSSSALDNGHAKTARCSRSRLVSIYAHEQISSKSGIISSGNAWKRRSQSYMAVGLWERRSQKRNSPLFVALFVNTQRLMSRPPICTIGYAIYNQSKLSNSVKSVRLSVRHTLVLHQKKQEACSSSAYRAKPL